MSLNDLMGKIRYWDNRVAKWMVRHFYVIVFEVFLVVIFILFFIVCLNVLDIGASFKHDLTHQLELHQTYIFLIIAFLFFLNSFWMLYMFNEIIRIRSAVKELNFNLTKRRSDS